MNQRRKQRHRAHQYWLQRRAILEANRGEPVLTECKRCHRIFMPEWIEGLAKWSHHCTICQGRNLYDGLGLPTPPALIDPHSLRPTLTEAEFRRELAKPL